MKKFDSMIRIIVLVSMVLSMLMGPGYNPASVVHAQPVGQEEVPTETPVLAPTEIPTSTPTATDLPTDVPVDVPIDVPTDRPIVEPTQEPTTTPFEISTEIPTPTATLETLLPTEAATPTPDPTPTPLADVAGFFSIEAGMLSDGTPIEAINIIGPPAPPPGFDEQRQAVGLPEANIFAGSNVLTVPAFNWVYGCSAVSGGMIAGYYDRNGFANMYTGPTNGGVMPLDNSSWPTWSDGIDTWPSIPLTASKNGIDGRTTRGSIDDYWVYYGSTASDPYISNGWSQHAWGDAIGDYMWTSQSANGNVDSSTMFWNYTSISSPLSCDVLESNGFADGTLGRKNFYENRGYTVSDCYNQKTDNNIAGGFSFAQYQAEINAGRPVMINLAGHTVVGVGYNTTGNTVYIHDTWDFNNHSFTWGGSYSGMVLQSVSIVNLQQLVTLPQAPTPSTPSGPISDTTPTYVWSKVSDASSYQLVVFDTVASTNVIIQKVNNSYCDTNLCSYTPNIPLNTNRNYQWMVKSTNSSGNSEYSSILDFSIPLPLVPTPSSPSGSISTIFPTFQWSNISNATSYRIAVYDNVTYSFVITETVSSSSCAISTCSFTTIKPLIVNRSYKWKIYATNSYGSSAFSSYLGFIVLQPPTPTPSIPTPSVSKPLVPTPSSPSGSISTIFPTFQWSNISNATSYRIAVYDNVTYSFVITETVSSSSCAISTCSFTTIKPLIVNRSYKWKIYATNSYGSSAFSSYLGFIVLQPPTPTPSIPTPSVSKPLVPTPSSPSGSISTIFPTFQWSNISNATSYRIVVYDNVTYSFVITETVSSSSCAISTCSFTTIKPLIVNRSYKWKIYATNSYGSSAFSSYLGFIVK